MNVGSATTQDRMLWVQLPLCPQCGWATNQQAGTKAARFGARFIIQPQAPLPALCIGDLICKLGAKIKVLLLR